jgi:hypothetical protein
VRVRGFWMVATEVARVPARPTWGRVRVRGEGEEGSGGYEGLFGTVVSGRHDGGGNTDLRKQRGGGIK